MYWTDHLWGQLFKAFPTLESIILAMQGFLNQRLQSMSWNSLQPNFTLNKASVISDNAWWRFWVPTPCKRRKAGTWHRPAQVVTWEYFLITKKISKTGNDTWHLLSCHCPYFKRILCRKHLTFVSCIFWCEFPFPGFSRTNLSTVCSFSTSDLPQNSTLIKFLLFPTKHNAWKRS